MTDAEDLGRELHTSLLDEARANILAVLSWHDQLHDGIRNPTDMHGISGDIPGDIPGDTSGDTSGAIDPTDEPEAFNLTAERHRVVRHVSSFAPGRSVASVCPAGPVRSVRFPAMRPADVVLWLPFLLSA